MLWPQQPHHAYAPSFTIQHPKNHRKNQALPCPPSCCCSAGLYGGNPLANPGAHFLPITPQKSADAHGMPLGYLMDSNGSVYNGSSGGTGSSPFRANSHMHPAGPGRLGGGPPPSPPASQYGCEGLGLSASLGTHSPELVLAACLGMHPPNSSPLEGDYHPHAHSQQHHQQQLLQQESGSFLANAGFGGPYDVSGSEMGSEIHMSQQQLQQALNAAGLLGRGGGWENMSQGVGSLLSRGSPHNKADQRSMQSMQASVMEGLAQQLHSMQFGGTHGSAGFGGTAGGSVPDSSCLDIDSSGPLGVWGAVTNLGAGKG
jgi:hypothetical protein